MTDNFAERARQRMLGVLDGLFRRLPGRRADDHDFDEPRLLVLGPLLVFATLARTWRLATGCGVGRTGSKLGA